MSEDRDHESPEDRDREPPEERDQEPSEDRDSDDRDEGSSDDRDEGSSDDRDEGASDDRDAGASGDRAEESSGDRAEESSEDADDGENDHEEGRDEDSPTDRRQDSSAGASRRRTAAWAVAAVRSQFPDLSGQALEQVTGVAKGEDSTWTVGVEVLEIRMVPDTADILAQYDVVVDQDGDIVGYRRIRRYLRGRADD